MEGKTYEETLHCLKLCALEERSNGQDLIEAFKMYKGLSRLFTFDNVRGNQRSFLETI